jgi:Berberine and berberine like
MGLAIAAPGHGLPDELVGRPVVLVAATHCGSLEQAERDLQPLRGLDPLLDTFAPNDFIALQTMSDEEMRWGRRFYMKGAYLDSFPADLVDVIVEQTERAPEGCSIPIWAQGGAIKPFSTAGHYVNDLVESGEDLVRFAYGAEKYERLRTLKRTYDPDNVFRMNQNIRP